MRVYHKKSKIIGEIVNIYDDSVDVIYSETNVAGWNKQSNYKKINLMKLDCEILDNGLNSEWFIDLIKFECLLKQYIQL